MNRIYDKQEIARMLDKFMAGETSLNEEQMLAEYFRTNEVGDEWQEYKEMFALFDGTMDRHTAIERMKKNTRVYAKKQLTWLKRDTTITWCHPSQCLDTAIELLKTAQNPKKS